MNRYHMAILFCGIALVLFFIVDVRANALFNKNEADNQVRDTLHFAVSSATNTLASEYGGANDCYTMSHNFFTALSIMNNPESIRLGRVLPEDFYPHVPVMVYLEEGYYNLGYFTGTDYRWEKELSYTEDLHKLSELSEDEIVALLEEKLTERINNYHDKLGLPDVYYTLPDYAMRNPKDGTFLVVLENFPTMIHGYYYSGVYSKMGSIKK